MSGLTAVVNAVVPPDTIATEAQDVQLPSIDPERVLAGVRTHALVLHAGLPHHAYIKRMR